jgi:glycosyltransferase involved in cell wall biosynthesis
VAAAALDVSVVVPTRDRPASLGRCLAALARQRYGGDWEIVVVDDGSRDAEAVAASVAAVRRARMLRSEGLGPAAARNRGARAAEGSILCFTDDDCEPSIDWLARLVVSVGNGADAAGGATVNASAQDPLAEASQTIAQYLVERSLAAASAPTFATSNNLACTAEAFAAVPFDERYPGAGGEDRDWCARLAARGLELVIEPSALVLHWHERDFRGFWLQHVAYGRGAFRYRRTHRFEGWLEPPRFYRGLVRAGLARGPAVGGFVCVAQLATAAGFLSEAARRGR